MMERMLAAVLRCAAWLFGDDAGARVFAPLVADWAHEQRQATTSWHRGLMAARWTLALITTAACVWWRAPGWRATRAFGLFSTVGTLLLIAPFVRYLPSWPSHTSRLLVYLTPQAMALALPFAVLPMSMILGARATSASAGRLRCRLAAMVTGIAVVTAIDLAWVVPEANQAFRETARAARGPGAGALPRGVRELGIADLWFARGVAPDVARRELQAKAAIALAWPVALAVLGWRLGRHRQSAPAAALVFWWLAAAALTSVSEPARHIAVVRESPYLVVAAAWSMAALAFRRGGPASWRPEAPLLRRS